MTIGSLMSRMGTADKLSIPQIQQAIKDGTLPAYVGVPLIQDKMKKEQAMRAGQAPQQQPTIADQVMAQAEAAEQSRGIPQLESNLPVQSMAGGGIVAFASGGSYDDELDDEDQDAADLAMATGAMDDAAISRAIMSRSDAQKPSYSSLPAALTAIPAGIGSLVHKVTESFSRPSEETAKDSGKGKHKYHEQIVSEARKLSLSPDFALRIAQKETGNLADPAAAVSPAGALGVMQLMPKTARGLGVKDPLNPEENISGGVRYAKQMLDKYGDEKLAAMAYNWGPGNVDKWLKSGKGLEALPRETRNYAAAFAEGGQVARFQVGGSGASAMGPYATEAEQLLAEARARAAARAAAARGIPAAAPAVAPAAEGITGLSPAAAQTSKTWGQRLLGSFGSAMGAPAAVTAAGGAGLSALSTNYLNRLPDESLDALMGDVGSDTSFGAAIMKQARENERNAPPARPAAQKDLNLPAAQASTAGPSRGKQGGPTAAELKRADFEKAIGATQDAEDMEAGQALAAQAAAAVPAPKEPAKAEPSSMDEYLKLLKGGYEDVKKQKEEDKYLALLAAGLGMMGGTSPYAAANIGSGAMHGVAALAASNKERAAERAALDKSYGQALYRQNLGQMTAAQREALLAEKIREADINADIARGRLGETSAQHAQTNLQNAVKLVDSAFKSNIENIGKSDADREAYVYSHPLVRKAATAAGLDVSSLGSAGQPKYSEKQQSLLDRWLK